MLHGNCVRIAALVASLWALPASGQDADRQAPAGTPEGHFVITPSNPALENDPEAFRLNAPLVALGQDRDDRMTVPVRIGDGGPYHFVIDTGSQRTIIAKELARQLALPELPPVEIISMAGRVTVSAVRLGNLSVGAHSIESLAALSIAHSDMGGAGIIGLDGLKDKRLTLDFAERRMEVGTSRRRPDRAEPDTIVVRARSQFGQLILVNSRVDGRRVSVILDTGAEMSIGNMALFRSLKLKRLVIPPQPTTLRSVTGIEVPAQFTIVRRLTIGSAQLVNVPMVFLDAAPFDELELGDKPAMLLGMRMLRMFDRIAIDFGNRHVDFHLKGEAGLPGSASLAGGGAAAAALR